MHKVPDEDRERWVARLRERARRDAEELVPDPPFDVYGVVVPKLRPVALAETQRGDGQWESIGLAYGDWADPAGPFVSVNTSRLEEAQERQQGSLLRMIDRERNRIAMHADVDGAEPAEPPDYSQATLTVGDEQFIVLRGRHGGLQAARLLTGALTVAVAGRGVDLESLRLAVVTDLRPYLEGRNEMLGRFTEQRKRRPPPVLEPAEGVAAYRALVDVELSDLISRESARRAGREPRYRARQGEIRHALWQRAAAEQERLSGVGRGDADDIVTLVMNHIIQLQEKLTWFSTQPALRDAAISETLRYSVLGQDVPSRSAQQAWARYWAGRVSQRGIEPGPALFAAVQAGTGLLEDWLREWQAWAAER